MLSEEDIRSTCTSLLNKLPTSCTSAPMRAQAPAKQVLPSVARELVLS
jgi:hypothetical protein